MGLGLHNKGNTQYYPLELDTINNSTFLKLNILLIHSTNTSKDLQIKYLCFSKVKYKESLVRIRVDDI